MTSLPRWSLVLVLLVCLSSAPQAAVLDADPSCVLNNLREPVSDKAGHVFHQTPRANHSYGLTCGLSVRIDQQQTATPVPIAVSIATGRIREAEACGHTRLVARLWKQTTSGPIEVEMRRVAGQWDGQVCSASTTWSASQLTRGRDQIYYVQAAAYYGFSSGSSRVVINWQVRSTRTEGRTSYAASASTRNSIGVSRWVVWFTKPGTGPYGGDPALGGQPTDDGGTGYQLARNVAYSNYEAPLVPPGDDRERGSQTMMVMQGFDSAGKSLGYIATGMYREPASSNALRIGWANPYEAGTARILVSPATVLETSLRQDFLPWVKYARMDMEANRALLGFACESQQLSATFAMYGCVLTTAAGLGLAITATAGTATLALPFAFGTGLGACLHAANNLLTWSECKSEAAQCIIYPTTGTGLPPCECFEEFGYRGMQCRSNPTDYRCTCYYKSNGAGTIQDIRQFIGSPAACAPGWKVTCGF